MPFLVFCATDKKPTKLLSLRDLVYHWAFLIPFHIKLQFTFHLMTILFTLNLQHCWFVPIQICSSCSIEDICGMRISLPSVSTVVLAAPKLVLVLDFLPGFRTNMISIFVSFFVCTFIQDTTSNSIIQ